MSKSDTTRQVYCPNMGGMKVECETPNACAGGADCRRGVMPPKIETVHQGKTVIERDGRCAGRTAGFEGATMSDKSTEADRAYSLRVHDLLRCAIDTLQSVQRGSLVYARDAAQPISRKAATKIENARRVLDEVLVELYRVTLHD